MMQGMFRMPKNGRDQRCARSFSAVVCVLAVVLLYAPLAGTAWSSYQAACCMSGQCPIAAHHHHKAPAAPSHHMDCGHEMANMTACSMSCCGDSDHPVVTSALFVLPPAVTVAALVAIKSPIESAKPLNFLRSIEPLAPPPRFVAAAA
jgi:hypothetical protein